MILRDFLFLDPEVLANYLSVLEGYILEGSIEETETGESKAGGKADIKVISGDGQVSKKNETKRKLALTEEARFDRLYQILKEQDALQYLEAFDEGIWKQLSRGEVLEVEARIRLPKALLLTQDVTNITPLLDLMKLVGQDPFQDEQSRIAFEGMRAVGQTIEDQAIPIIFEAISAKGFTFITHLPKRHIRRPLSELQGEATVFGKIQRILPKGEELEVFSLVPALTGAASLNRQQRRKIQKSAAKNNAAELVKGPAIILTPLAVYR